MNAAEAIKFLELLPSSQEVTIIIGNTTVTNIFPTTPKTREYIPPSMPAPSWDIPTYRNPPIWC